MTLDTETVLMSHAAELERVAYDVCMSDAFAVPELIAIADSTAEADERRREAIFALGRIGNRDALQYLTSHLGIYIPQTVQVLEEQSMLEWPCLLALRNGDWRHGQAILDRLALSLTRHQQMIFATSLRRIFGNRRALALLASDRSKAKSEIHENNILAVELLLDPQE